MTSSTQDAGPDDRQAHIEQVKETIQATIRPEPVPSRPWLRVAVAASVRLRRGLAWEWDQVELDAATGVDRLETSGAELLLVEIRAGSVPGWGPIERGPVELAASARRRDVPVILWVTAAADPDGAAALVPLATAVFVSDGDSMASWRERWPDAPVEELSPAVAPRLHSPAHGGPGAWRVGDAAFLADDSALDSTSQVGLETLVAPATSMKTLPAIHMWRPARGQAGADGTEPAVSTAVRNCVVAGRVADGSLPLVDHYRVVIDAARSSPYSTWTLLSAGAAQTAVVTLPQYKATLPADLKDSVATADDAASFGREIFVRTSQPELRDREALQLNRAVLGRHTFGHRVDTMLKVLGRPPVAADRSVSIVIPTNREHEIDNVLSNVARQEYRDTELILVLHGLHLNHADVRARALERGIDRLQVIDADSSQPLGAVMNLGVDGAHGRYLAKMDDDNFYGRHYLTDLVNAFASTDAGVVGKWAHYVWLRSINAVVLRYSYYQSRFHRMVQGGSIVVECDLAKDLRFSDIPRAVDTDFLNRAWAAGVKTYSADRFNYVSIRGSDHEQHTWKVTDTEMMVGGAKVMFYGDPRPHVDV